MLVIRKSLFDEICKDYGIEKAGLPVNTRHGNYVKTCDHPVIWEYKPLNRKRVIQKKTFTELSKEEKLELKNELLKQHYEMIDGVYVAKSKLKREDPDTLAQELNNAKRLVSLGHTVYLLPFGFAEGEKVRSPDSLTDDNFLEFKDVMDNSNIRNVRDDYISAKGQGDDVYINIHGDKKESDCINEIYRAIGIAKKTYPSNINGKLYMNFERTGKTLCFDINKNGLAKKTSPRHPSVIPLGN